MSPQRSHIHLRALRLLVGLGLALCLSVCAAGNAQAFNAHGQLLRLAPGRVMSALPAVNASQSSNWFGYNQGALEPGQTLFHSITGSWTVPKASQHKSHEAEYSSDWIGIGGGCENTSCSVTDSSLIQAGTEQDVGGGGRPSYSAWWEVIPSPSVPISGMKVRPGDHMHAVIDQVSPGVWKISIKDLTRHESYSTTAPYSSTEGSAEWIEETPLVLGGNSGFAPLPSLSKGHFDHGTANGHAVKLNRSQEIELTSSNGKVVGIPSGPDSDRDGFAACAWATSCRAPASS
ncbi:MAG TPA: G1 family glutamic endopeptidase [Solirubrobacteraceae bacterium]|nr:G1 family glutamic endopeptidase [Solirubrobacteraceae bacterium]